MGLRSCRRGELIRLLMDVSSLREEDWAEQLWTQNESV